MPAHWGLPWGGDPHPLPAASCKPQRGWVENEELRDGKGKFQTNWSSTDTEQGRGCGAPAQGGRAPPGRVRSWVYTGFCPPWAGSCTRAWKSTSPKGADDFLLGIEAAGRSSRWCFGCCWGKERGCRSSPWPLVGWRWPRYPQPSLGNSPTAAQQITKCSSTGWKLPCFQFKEQIMGYFPPKILGKKVCEHQMCGLLFPSYNWDGNPLHPVALKQGNKQPVLIIELHIAW